MAFIENIVSDPNRIIGITTLDRRIVSTLVPLAANASWDTGWVACDKYQSLTIATNTNVAGAANGYKVEFSIDAGVNISATILSTYSEAGFVKTTIFPITTGTFVRVTFLNGAIAQTTFFSSLILDAGVVAQTSNLFTPPISSTVATNVASTLFAPDVAGTAGIFLPITRTGNSLNLNLTGGSITIPAGAATEAKQDVGNTSLSTIAAKDFATQTTLALIKAKTDNIDVLLSTRTKPADSQTVTGTVAISGTVTITGGLTDTQLRATPVPVSGTFFQATQPVSGTFFQATQPVSAASLPLPSGASTSALQTTGNTSLANLDVLLSTRLKPADTLAAVTTLGSITGAITLPTGAATEATLSTIASRLDGATGSGSISALNGTLVLTPSGQTVFAFSITGTFVATLGIEGSTDGSSYYPIVGTVVGQEAEFVVAFLATTGLWVVNGTGYKNIRIRAIAYTSGTVNIVYSGTNGTQGSGLALATIAAKDFATQTTLALVKAKTDNIDVLLSTRTKPADTQKVDGSAVTQPVSGTFFQATQPISAASLPLPSGAALDSSLTTIDTDLKSAQPRKMQDGSGNALVAILGTDINYKLGVSDIQTRCAAEAQQLGNYLKQQSILSGNYGFELR